MQIRRPLAALFAALALVGGGALSACSSPTDARTGTPADHASLTAGNDPSGDSQGNLPDNSDRETTTGGKSGGNPNG
jgi:hypothetical protein